MAAKKKGARRGKSTSTSTKEKPAHGSKTEFVRGLPADMPAKDVVAKGKEKGLVLSEAYVYKIRSDSKKGPSSRSAAASASQASGSQSATDFVRNLPEGTSAAEAVKQATAAGIKLTTGYFYTLRSTLKLAGKKGPKPSGKASGGRASGSGLRLTSPNAHEQAVLDAVEALGIERVRSVVTALEKLRS